MSQAIHVIKKSLTQKSRTVAYSNSSEDETLGGSNSDSGGPDHYTRKRSLTWAPVFVERVEEEPSEKQRLASSESTAVKYFFLRVLQAKSNFWMEIAAKRREEIRGANAEVLEAFDRQSKILQTTHLYWVEKCGTDREYLESLHTKLMMVTRCKSLISPRGAAIGSKLEDTKESVARSSEWARRLLEMIESHNGQRGEAATTIRLGTEAVETAEEQVDEALQTVCPDGQSLPSEHCLWQAAQTLIGAWGLLHKAQKSALSGLTKLKHSAEILDRWVDSVVAMRDTSYPPPACGSPKRHLKEDSLEDIQTECEDGDDRSSDSESSVSSADTEVAELLELSSTANTALALHEQEVELCCSDPDGEGSWVPTRLLVSRDKWFHMWDTNEPLSSQLVQSICLARVVVEAADDNLRLVRISPKPPPDEIGFLSSLSSFFGHFGLPDEANRRDSVLFLRFADQECREDFLECVAGRACGISSFDFV